VVQDNQSLLHYPYKFDQIPRDILSLTRCEYRKVLQMEFPQISHRRVLNAGEEFEAQLHELDVVEVVFPVSWAFQFEVRQVRELVDEAGPEVHAVFCSGRETGGMHEGEAAALGYDKLEV
jgi:hypothetical protein